ncbi:unnamed protein product, partial [marine sediment metagenome]
LLPGVEEIIPVSKPYKLASREFHPRNTVVRVNGVAIGGDEIVIMAGPCAIDESRGETRRGIENVEVATGIPSLMMGYNLEDIATGIDEYLIRQPLGVFGIIGPFNFPFMIPLWSAPYAVATGNTVVIKPSSEVPLSQRSIAELVDEAGFPPGVWNVVNGGRTVVNGMLEHPDI